MHRRALASAFAFAVALIIAHGATGVDEQSKSPAAIVFERGGDLFAIALNGSRAVRLTNTPVWEERNPAVSPDGRSIAYSRSSYSGGATLWIMAVDGRVRERITRGYDTDPAWSPDGRTIYFARFLTQADEGPNHSFNESCGSIFRIGANGSDVRRLTNPPWKDSFHSHFAPAVSPGGGRIAFTDANQCSGGTTSFALRVVDTSGRETSELSQLRGNAYHPVSPEYGAPAWSPDGSWLVFTGNGALYIASRDGTGLRRLTPKRLSTGLPEQDAPVWSPDGERIAFTASLRDRLADLYVVRPDGTELRRLTRTKASESSPDWLPRLPSR